MLAASTVFLAVHWKVRNVREALEQLVASKTHGKFSLLIHDYSLEWSPLTISFDSLLITRNDSVKSSVKQVIAPKLVLTIGSAIDFVRNEQVEVRLLYIDEPVIKLEPEGSHHKKELHLSQQIVKLYPAVEALLEHFNVVHFEIKRASLDVRKHSGTDLQLGLIDLLVENWNVKALNPDRQLRLAIGGQEVSLAKGSLTFAGLEYNFRKRELRFSEFAYESQDTITHSSFQVLGDYIAFKRLDYHELFEHQRLVYDKITIERPTVHARLQIKTRQGRGGNTEQMISDVVRRTVGELSLDSALIHEAAFHLTLRTDQDSLQLELPSLTIRTNQIQVIPDSIFSIGEIEIDMQKTRVALKQNLTLSLDQISVDNKGLRIEDLQLHERTGQKIALIPYAEIIRLDLFQLAAHKRIVAESVEVRDAQVNLMPEFLSGRHAQSAANKRPPSIDIRNIILHEASLSYEDEGRSLRANAVNATVRSLKTDSLHKINFLLDQASFGNALVRVIDERLEASVQQFRFGGRSISVKGLALTRDSLRLEVRNLMAVHKDGLSDVKAIDHARWDAIAFEHIDITGRHHLAQSPQPSAKAPSSFRWGADKIKVGMMTMNIAVGDSLLQGSVDDLSVEKVRGDEKQAFGFDAINAFSKELRVRTEKVEASVEKMCLRWPTQIEIEKVTYAGSGNQASIHYLSVDNIQQENDQWLVSSVKLRAAHLAKEAALDVAVDSVHIKSIGLKAKSPHIGFVEVFNPRVVVLANGKPEQKKKASPIPTLPVDRFVVHPGSVLLPQDKAIVFGRITGDMPGKRVSVEHVEHKMAKSSIEVNNLVVTDGRTQIDSILIIPNEHWYAENRISEPKLRMKISNLLIADQPFDSVFYRRKLSAAEVEIGNLDLQVARDKRLPEPAPIEKPWSLGTLIRLPSSLDIKTIRVKDGDVTVHETSDKTEQTGMITINDVRATLNLENSAGFNEVTMDAQARLYNQGRVMLNYTTPHPDTFRLTVRLNDFDLTHLNQMVYPTQSIEIESGYITRYLAEMVATNDNAVGASGIGYKKLHITIHGKKDQTRKGVAGGVMTFVADNLVLKNNKKWVRTEFEQERLKHKSVFNYWVRLSARGAIEVVVNGN
jgi:hypothetical protein